MLSIRKINKKSFRTVLKCVSNNNEIRSKCSHLHSSVRCLNVPSWSTVDPYSLGSSVDNIYDVSNIVNGKWQVKDDVSKKLIIPNPLSKSKPPIFTVPDTSKDELLPFLKSMNDVKKSGVHNPLKNPERYLLYGEISRQVRCVMFHFCESLIEIFKLLFFF